jgi:large subunit ribosomal protein L18e
MSTRERTQVNVSHLNRMSEVYKGKVLVVPGKVLSTGNVTSAFDVAAFAFSESAKQKIVAAKGKAMTLEELVSNKIPANKMILVK